MPMPNARRQRNARTPMGNQLRNVCRLLVPECNDATLARPMESQTQRPLRVPRGRYDYNVPGHHYVSNNALRAQQRANYSVPSVCPKDATITMCPDDNKAPTTHYVPITMCQHVPKWYRSNKPTTNALCRSTTPYNNGEPKRQRQRLRLPLI